ncbi:acyltransferase family protein [Billgrantia pellis]|nr:acyltransferase [Halomonas pellis]
MPRICSIDYLRGIMALAVMVYHFLSWSLGVPDSGTLVGRLGVYAVSTFYIISGISLYLVYQNTRWSFREIGSYVLKRYFRIAPAFWVATLLMITFYVFKNSSFVPDWPKYASNFSLTFGFYNPRDYIPGGGWSIGNEMVFYAFFPLLIVATRNAWLFLTALALTFLIYIWFAFFMLSPRETLAEQWSLYINPMNQAFLFALGVALGWLRDTMGSPSKVTAFSCLILSTLLFCFYPAEGNQIGIVTSDKRILFTFFCGALCFSVLHLNLNNTFFSPVLKFFGDISYSLYLLHSVAATYVLQLLLPIMGEFSPFEKAAVLFIFVSPMSICISYLLYRYIEKPAIRAGKKITSYRKAGNAIGETA